MILPDYEALAGVREKHKKQSIVVAAGTFDLAHPGHVLFFEDCKRLGDILVVVVGGDYDCRRYKGNKRPIWNEKLRIAMVDALKPVDYAVMQEICEEHLLGSYDRLFSFLHPDVYACNHDVRSENFRDAADTDYRRKLAAKHGARFVLLDRTCPSEYENVSTTNIIKKILALHGHK